MSDFSLETPPLTYYLGCILRKYPLGINANYNADLNLSKIYLTIIKFIFFRRSNLKSMQQKSFLFVIGLFLFKLQSINYRNYYKTPKIAVRAWLNFSLITLNILALICCIQN